jgi:hypothetical protein
MEGRGRKRIGELATDTLDVWLERDGHGMTIRRRTPCQAFPIVRSNSIVFRVF